MKSDQPTITPVELLISVVLPAFNAEKYIAEAVRSILDQTLTNFELIVINDGSTDNTLAILEELRDKDARVIVISRENRGLVESLNEGIDLARGKWIARMDADDIALPHRFERQLEWLERTGADISGSWVQRFGSSDKRVVRLPQTDDAIKMAMLFCSPFAHPAVIMRTSLVKRLGYDKRWEKAEDYDLWERAAEAGWKMANVPEVLLSYRVHAEQISTLTANRQQQLTQGIRRRYGAFVSHSMRLNQSWIDEVLKISESSLSELDMDAVDAAFTGLLQQSHGEARDVVFDHATRLYFRAAANCPNIVSRWSKLNREFGKGFKVATKLQLWLFRLLQVRADGALFKQLKRIYIWRASR